MAQYRKIQIRIWHDERVLSLDADGKLLWLYLITGPTSNPIGLYRFSVGQASEDLRLPTARLTLALKQIIQTGLAEYDEALNVVWVRSQLKHDPPTSMTTATMMIRLILESSKTHLRNKLIEYIQWLVSQGLASTEPSVRLASGLAEAITPIPSPIPIPLPLPVPIEDEEKTAAVAAVARAALDDLNEVTSANHPPTETNLKYARGRIKEGATIEDFKVVHRFKFSEWSVPQKDGKDMGQYLRPVTLWAPTKFAGYVAAARKAEEKDREWADVGF